MGLRNLTRLGVAFGPGSREPHFVAALRALIPNARAETPSPREAGRASLEVAAKLSAPGAPAPGRKISEQSAQEPHAGYSRQRGQRK